MHNEYAFVTLVNTLDTFWTVHQLRYTFRDLQARRNTSDEFASIKTHSSLYPLQTFNFDGLPPNVRPIHHPPRSIYAFTTACLLVARNSPSDPVPGRSPPSSYTVRSSTRARTRTDIHTPTFDLRSRLSLFPRVVVPMVHRIELDGSIALG